MANKTSNSKSQEQSMKITVQSQLAKIKKEEEEELWISGEELYTEGSSDEEDHKVQSRSRRKVNNNQASRNSSANPSIERGYSPVSIENKGKSMRSKDTIENQSLPKTTSNKSSRSSSIESQRTDRLSTVESSAYSMTKDSVFSSGNESANTEISWKARRELSYNNEELCEDKCNDSLDTLSINTEDEWIKKEIFQVKNLDNLIHAMNDKVKKASDETLFYQYENRKWLESILSKSPSETGKLAENTREFFYLCPKYTMLNEDSKITEVESRKSNESNISLETNDSKQRTLENEGSVNPDNEDQWNLTDANSNPYTIDQEMKEALLEVEEKVLQSDNISNKHNTIFKFGAISTEKNLQDNNFIKETIKEIRIIDTSLVNIA